jgi:hypothetical protein
LLTSSIAASFGMLMVLEIAPEMNGCAAAIISICASVAMNRAPYLPHLLAQSKIG